MTAAVTEIQFSVVIALILARMVFRGFDSRAGRWQLRLHDF